MKSKITIITAFLLTLPAVLFAAWGRGAGPCFGGSYMGGPGWFGGPFFGGGLFTMLLSLIIIGFLIFLAVKYFRKTDGDSLKKENPVDILKTRYAKGEITKEVFNQMKNDIAGVK